MRKIMKEHEAIKFLLDKGLLFEINRTILHPLGLALAVTVSLEEHDNGEYKFDGMWDSRDDPEGIIFDDEVLKEGDEKLHKYMCEEGFNSKNVRYENLGYICQQRYDDNIVIKKAQEFKKKLYDGDIEETEEKL